MRVVGIWFFTVTGRFSNQIITFVISCFGVKLGNVFGDKYEKKAELAGGIVLVLIGLKILLEHLGILVL